MAGQDDWWRQYDDQSGEPSRQESAVPAHWLEGREHRPQAESAAPQPREAGETTSDLLSPPPVAPAAPTPLRDIIEPEAPAPTGTSPGILFLAALGVALVAVAMLFALRSGQAVPDVAIDAASLEVPADFAPDPRIGRDDFGLGSDFSEPLAFRSGDDLLVAYARPLAAADVEDEVSRISGEGVFAAELLSGAQGFSVGSDEPFSVGLGGRRVVLASDTGAQVEAVTFVGNADAGAALVVVILSGEADVDLPAVAEAIRLTAS